MVGAPGLDAAAIAALPERLGIGDAVSFLGRRPTEEVAALYRGALALVYPSLLEGFGLPLAEALACETPVVATDAGSAAEVIGPGGILTPPRHPAALAEAISTLLDNPARRRDLGRLGRDHIIRHFSLQTMVESTLEAYHRFLA